MIKKLVKPYSGRIRMPGIYARMPIEKYHAADAAIEPSISSSGLRTIFTESPKHFWATSPLNQNRIENIAESDALKFGRAAHHLLFGEASFNSLFAVPPETLGGETFSLKRNVCRIWKQQREEEGKTFIRREEFVAILGMRDALSRHPLVKAGALNGLIETSWFAKHQKTGLWIKIRPDAVPTDSIDFVDLKTSAFIDRYSLERALYEYGYFIQAGLVAMVVQLILGVPLQSFNFLFIEKKPPHDIAVVTLKENEIARGIRVAEHTLGVFASCLASGQWPGRYDAERKDTKYIEYIEMPEWAQKDIDARLKNGG